MYDKISQQIELKSKEIQQIIKKLEIKYFSKDKIKQCCE